MMKAALPQYTGHSFQVLFVSYFLILVILVIGLKYVYFPNSSPIEILLDITILIVSSLKSAKSQGYSPPVHHEEVDDSNSIAVGYSVDQGKQLFWEKNSV